MVHNSKSLPYTHACSSLVMKGHPRPRRRPARRPLSSVARDERTANRRRRPRLGRLPLEILHHLLSALHLDLIDRYSSGRRRLAWVRPPGEHTCRRRGVLCGRRRHLCNPLGTLIALPPPLLMPLHNTLGGARRTIASIRRAVWSRSCGDGRPTAAPAIRAIKAHGLANDDLRR